MYEYPNSEAGTNQKEKFIRDIEFLNYHINHDKWRWFMHQHPQMAHRWEDDFDAWDSEHYNISTTENGSGNASEAITDMVNGVLLITNDDADNDNDEITLQGESWKLLTGYPLYAEIRFKLSDATQSDFWFGLITGTTFFTAPNDYVVFKKDDGDVNLDFAVAKDGTGSDTDTTVDLADGVWKIVGFHFDGNGTIRWFVFTDGDEPQTCAANGSVTANIPDDEELTLGFGLQNGEGAAKALYVDYIYCAQRRVRE